MASMMNKTISTITTALVAVILIQAVLIPIAVNMITNLLSSFADSTEVKGYSTLLYVVITVVIVGIVIGVVKTYDDEFGFIKEKIFNRDGRDE